MGCVSLNARSLKRIRTTRRILPVTDDVQILTAILRPMAHSLPRTSAEINFNLYDRAKWSGNHVSIKKKQISSRKNTNRIVDAFDSISGFGVRTAANAGNFVEHVEPSGAKQNTEISYECCCR